MKSFKISAFILLLILVSPIISAQNFIDDLYYNDSEVDYSFLYQKNDVNENLINNDSINYEENWDDEMTYENRIRKFHNPYHFDYYWDYGSHSPSWYSWNSPSWGWSLNYHNYNWGNGIHYGASWHSPYSMYSYNPWYHSHQYHLPNYYYPGYYDYYGWGANNYVVLNGNHNFSYGHRDSENTNINQNIVKPQRAIRNTLNNKPANQNLTNTRPQRTNNLNTGNIPSKTLNRPVRNNNKSNFNKIIEKLTKPSNYQKEENNYNSNRKQNKNYKSNNRSQSSSRSSRSSTSNSNRSRRN
jgi:hypothetical protein